MADKTRVAKIYAFDCNDTLEVLGGPVTFESIRALKAANPNYLFGLSGHWWEQVPVEEIQAWCDFVGPFSFKKKIHGRKRKMLQVLMSAIPSDDYVLVGNDGVGQSQMPGHAMSDEKSLAAELGWRWIKESDFAAGSR